MYTLCPYYVLLIIISCIYSFARKHACTQLLVMQLFIHSTDKGDQHGDHLAVTLDTSTLVTLTLHSLTEQDGKI